MGMALFGSSKPDVERMKADRDVEGLIKALGYGKDSNVRSEAAMALGGLFDGRIVNALAGALADEDANVRMDVVQALGRLRDPRAPDALAIAIKDPDPGVRSMALKILISYIHSLKVEPDVDGLVRAIAIEDHYIRLNAISALGEVGDERAVAVLVDASLKDPYYPVRFEAAEALRKIKDKRAVDLLIKALKDQDATARYRAAETLGKIGDLRAMNALSAALDDQDGSVRYAAMCSLGKIGDPRVMNMIVAAMKRQGIDARGP
jgi:HEAT repeat protein